MECSVVQNKLYCNPRNASELDELQLGAQAAESMLALGCPPPTCHRSRRSLVGTLACSSDQRISFCSKTGRSLALLESPRPSPLRTWPDGASLSLPPPSPRLVSLSVSSSLVQPFQLLHLFIPLRYHSGGRSPSASPSRQQGRDPSSPLSLSPSSSRPLTAQGQEPNKDALYYSNPLLGVAPRSRIPSTRLNLSLNRQRPAAQPTARAARLAILEVQARPRWQIYTTEEG